MTLKRVPCVQEVRDGTGAGGAILQADALAQADALLAAYADRVQCIYIDPPFFTGQRFSLRMRVGADDWRTGKASLLLPAYDDRWEDEKAFLSMMERALRLAHALLSPEGSLFLHIDARMHAQLRLLLDTVFGASNFMNEIVWAYQTGGRAKQHFSRKHDIILFYRKSPQVYFCLDNVAVPREAHRDNHMRRAVDEQGRAYRSIRSAGKEYRYYDDEPVYPGDVWDDVSHLQQKDPQRTGYDTQKPLKLLERVLLCTTRPGDLVADFFLGSGTSAVAAAMHGRAFLGVDVSPASMQVVRKRLLPYRLSFECEDGAGAPSVSATYVTGISDHEVTLECFEVEPGPDGHVCQGMDTLDQWSAGYLRDGVFHAMADAARSKQQPHLPKRLNVPVLSGDLAVLTYDIYGRRTVHAFA